MSCARFPARVAATARSPGIPFEALFEGLESRTMFNVTQTAAVSPVQLAPELPAPRSI